jgi:hypothetical protein
MDLLINPVTNDVVFDNTTRMTSSYEESVVQRLKIRLWTFLGEWFLDVTEGVPYFESVFVKVRDKSFIDLIFQEAILKDTGVENIISFSSTLSSDRRYSFEFSCQLNNGAVTPLISFDNIGI